MGNFDRNSGFPPFTESGAFSLWSNIKRRLFYQHGVRYLVGWITIVICLLLIASARRRSISRVVLAGVYALSGMAITSLLISSLADAVVR